MKTVEVGWTCSTPWMDEKNIQNLVGKHEGKIPFRECGSRWEDNIEKNLEEVGCESVDWIHLAQDGDQRQALVNTVINLQFL
jgi:hypothetical protein